MNNLTVEKATIMDVPYIIKIIQDKINWFKQNNIKQWTKYHVYDSLYFLSQINKGVNELYVLRSKECNVCGCMMVDKETYKDAYKIKHLMSNEKGGGNLLINKAIERCKQDHKKYLRLDCVASNGKLIMYYLSKGFKDKGIFDDNNGYTYTLFELEIE